MNRAPAESAGRSTRPGQLTREPVPGWVVHEPYARPEQPEERFVRGGACRLLQDLQVDLSGPEEACHHRHANRVVTQAWAEAAAYVAADFDPRYQRVEIHFVRVLRGDAVIDRTDLERFQILRRERDPERRVFDARLTAALDVPDVRPGDVVEVSYTVYGANPVLAGHYSSWVGFDGMPVLDLRHRLRHRATRKISLLPLNDPPAPSAVEKDGVIDLAWRAERPSVVESEPFSPPWLIRGAATQLSDAANWGEIASLFAPLYETAIVPEELQRAVDELAASSPTPAACALEALRFVGKKLRSLALPLGESNLAPRGVEAIWSTGYGDCKDAARLYVAIARRLGLDAAPALVSSTHGRILNTLLPSVSVFNRCIVRVRIDGRTYWLDPAMRTGAGSLDVLAQPYAGWALPLEEGASALERIAEAEPIVVAEADEHVKFGQFVATEAKFERRIVYASWRADLVREAIANQGLAKIAEDNLKELQAAWPNGVAEGEPMRVEDKPETGTLTTFESYKLARCWRSKPGGLVSFASHDTVIGRELSLLPSVRRKTELYLGRARIVRRFVHFHMPGNWACASWDRTMEMPGLVYRTKLAMEKKRLLVFSQLVAVSAESAPADCAGTYNEIAGEILEGRDVVLSARNDAGEIKKPRARVPWRWAAYVLFLLALLGVLGLFLWR